MSTRDEPPPLESLTVLLAQQGDADALSWLIERYDRRLMYFVRRILGGEDGAFDVLQTVWLTVHRRLRTLREPDAFRVWLYRIAHDHAVSELRRRAKGPVTFDEVEPVAVADDGGDFAFESADLVHAGLALLSVDHRRVLTLRFLEEMTLDEIASVVGCNAGTVKSRLHYAKLALRQRIEELLHDADPHTPPARVPTPAPGGGAG